MVERFKERVNIIIKFNSETFKFLLLVVLSKRRKAELANRFTHSSSIAHFHNRTKSTCFQMKIFFQTQNMLLLISWFVTTTVVRHLHPIGIHDRTVHHSALNRLSIFSKKKKNCEKQGRRKNTLYYTCNSKHFFHFKIFLQFFCFTVVSFSFFLCWFHFGTFLQFRLWTSRTWIPIFFSSKFFFLLLCQLLQHWCVQHRQQPNATKTHTSWWHSKPKKKNQKKQFFGAFFRYFVLFRYMLKVGIFSGFGNQFLSTRSQSCRGQTVIFLYFFFFENFTVKSVFKQLHNSSLNNRCYRTIRTVSKQEQSDFRNFNGNIFFPKQNKNNNTGLVLH